MKVLYTYITENAKTHKRIFGYTESHESSRNAQQANIPSAKCVYKPANASASSTCAAVFASVSFAVAVVAVA